MKMRRTYVKRNAIKYFTVNICCKSWCDLSVKSEEAFYVSDRHGVSRSSVSHM